jgi:serine/threonine-protein kinase RsbW
MIVNTQPQNYELLLPGDAASLAQIRWVVTRLAHAAGLDTESVDRIEMAVDEACTNVLDHAYKLRKPKPPLHIEISSSAEQFMVDVLDDGEGIDFASYTEPKFPDHWEEGNVRGVGLYLIQKLMDEVHYEQLPNRFNRMRLIKHVNKPSTLSINVLAGPVA